MPRSPLFVSTLTLVLMVLLLACGADEPTERPDSDRAMIPPTVIATATPPTAVATPAPAIDATTRRPLVQTSPETDREALITLYNATNGADWKRNNDWLTRAPLDDWYGVTTDDNGRVVELYLTGNELSEEIPPELGNLASLKELWLSGNELSGEIPPELGNLASLTELALSGNELSGCVPSSLQDKLDMSYSDLGDLRFCP